MPKTALLVVDVQRGLMAAVRYEGERMLSSIAHLKRAAKEKGCYTVYIRHSGGPGGELEMHSEGWEIAPEIAADKEDAIFDKDFNSAFLHTGLDEYLRSKNVERLIVTGMQTEFCIDATVKSAFERGYEILLPRGTTSTFDNDVMTGQQTVHYFENKIWDGRYARVLSVEEAEACME